MAVQTKTVRVSDKSGKEIPDGAGARVRVVFYDKEKIDLRADLTDAEVRELVKDFGLAEVEPRTYRAGERRNRR